MPKIIVSAVVPNLADGMQFEELPHTRQEVADEATAKRIVFARNEAATRMNGREVWGYYEEAD